MRIVATLEDVYVPKWNGNRDLPEADQVTVQIKWPTASERDQLKSWTAISSEDGAAEIRVKFRTDKILRDHVGDITNLEVTYNGKPVKVTGGRDLAETKVLALQGLIDELKAYITSEDGLEDEAEKN